MSLSSLIVQREIATIREVEEALARQVLYGADLVTNLLEVSRVDESALMPAVAEAYGLPPAAPGELPQPSDDAKRLVVAEVALERGFAPISVDRYGLVVAVAEPLSTEAEQELAFALALPISQRIAPYVRIRQALSRDYGVPLERRLQRLLARMRGERMSGSSYPPPRRASVKAPPRPPSKVPPAPIEKPVPKLRPSISGDTKTLIRDSKPGAEEAAPEVRPAVKRRRGPLTAEVAMQELEEALARDSIFDLVFEFARQFFDYTALFVVHGDVAEGRDSFGDGIARDKIVRLGVPLDLPGILATAREKKEEIRAVPARDGIDAVLMADLGRAGTTLCVVLPIIVRQRVVALLVGDGGPSGLDEMSLINVKVIVAAAIAAFERLLVRRKLKGKGPGPAASMVPDTKVSEQGVPVILNAPDGPMSVSKRESVEELAPPIRELLAEPRLNEKEEPGEDHEPSAARGRSDNPPPPANLLRVRRPSGAPIPREEPDSAARYLAMQAGAPQRGTSPGSMEKPPKSKSGSLRRAEAPPLDFGGSQASSMFVGETFARDESERKLLAEIQGGPVSPNEGAPSTSRDPGPPISPLVPPSSAPITLVGNAALPTGPIRDMRELEEPPHSPKAASPPPMPVAVAAVHVTDVSPKALPMLDGASTASGLPSLVDDDEAPISATLVDNLRGGFNDPDATPLAPNIAENAETPYAPAVISVQMIPSLPESPRQMPQSEQQISVAAHRPPSSRSDASRVLPSVIVDVASEYVTLVQRMLGGKDDEAEAELVRAGGYSMPAIMSQFPGPITIERERLDDRVLPRIPECGPILRVVASQRRTALPFVLSCVDDPDEERRFWATYLLTELVYPDNVEPVVARVFDEVPRVRRVARLAARALAEAHPSVLVERLAPTATNTNASTRDRVVAIETLGEIRDPDGVPVLLGLLDEAPAEVTSVARAALVTISRQDFGFALGKWQTWWSENKERHRLEWLIDALMIDQAALRAAAGEELKTITKEYFGYYDDLPKRERERAQQRYRDWWNTVGRVRFSRPASTRG